MDGSRVPLGGAYVLRTARLDLSWSSFSLLNWVERSTAWQRDTWNVAFSSSELLLMVVRGRLFRAKGTRPNVPFTVVPQLLKRRFRLPLFPSTLILQTPVHESSFIHARSPIVFAILNLILIVHSVSLAVTGIKKEKKRIIIIII